MVQMMQHSGHNPGLKCSVIWVPFPESPMIPMTVFQSCGRTQPLMTSNLWRQPYCWIRPAISVKIAISLNSLNTTFAEMRIGITKFQHYYLELYGCLDYLEIYKPWMEGARPPAESVMNCMGAITNIPCVVQDIYTAGVPVWLL